MDDFNTNTNSLQLNDVSSTAGYTTANSGTGGGDGNCNFNKSNTSLIPTDLLFEALDGFIFMLNFNGIIENTSENVHLYIKFTSVSLNY